MGEEEETPDWLNFDKQDSRPSFLTQPTLGSGKASLVGEVTTPDPAPAPVAAPPQPPKAAPAVNYGSTDKAETTAAVVAPPVVEERPDWLADSGPTTTTTSSEVQPLQGSRDITVTGDEERITIVNDEPTIEQWRSRIEARPYQPGRDYILLGFRVIDVIGIIILMFVLSLQAYEIFFEPPDEYVFVTTFLRIYVCAFCILFLLVEFDAPIPQLRKYRVFRTYLARGVIYTFMALVVMEEGRVDALEDLLATTTSKLKTSLVIDWAPLLMQITSYVLMGFGFLNLLMGCLCLRGVRDERTESNRAEWREYQENLHNFRANTV